MSRARRGLAVLLLLGAAGCSQILGLDDPRNPGGTGNAGVTVTGNINGSPIGTTDVIAVVGTDTLNGVEVNVVEIFITSASGLCGRLASFTGSANATGLGLVVGASSPVGPGTYTVDPNGAAAADFETTDAACNTSPSDAATSGTVTLVTVDADTIEGSFDLTFADGSLQGTFTAPVCQQVTPSSASQPKTSCM